MNSKAEIRKRILGMRNALSREAIERDSLKIMKTLEETDQILRASTLMVYLDFGSEVMTGDLIRWGWGAGKRIVVPFCRPASRELTACRIDGFDELEEGHYGIRAPRAGRLRPVSGGDIDAVIVPAVAFDRRGYRVGYGGGYYDRFLLKAPRAAKIGAVFGCQMIDAVPADGHDLPVEMIVTEKERLFPADRS